MLKEILKKSLKGFSHKLVDLKEITCWMAKINKANIQRKCESLTLKVYKVLSLED